MDYEFYAVVQLGDYRISIFLKGERLFYTKITRLFDEGSQENATTITLRPSAEQVIYKQKFTLPQVAKGKVHTVVVKQNNLPSIHKDTELSNLKVEAK